MHICVCGHSYAAHKKTLAGGPFHTFMLNNVVRRLFSIKIIRAPRFLRQSLRSVLHTVNFTMFSIRGPSRARAYSKEPLLPASSDDLPRSERSWSPSRKQRGWKRKLVPLRRREVYLFLLLGLACYTWSIERMWDREWVDWKRAASVEGSGASDSDGRSQIIIPICDCLYLPPERSRATDTLIGRSTTEMVYSHNDEMQGLDALVRWPYAPS